jgi:hypothetical protein
MIAAIRFSTSLGEYPNLRKDSAAFASFPLLRSHQGDLHELAREKGSMHASTYSGMKNHPAIPIAKTPYCETNIDLYAHAVVPDPSPFCINATRKGPNVNAMAAALLRIPLRGVGAIYTRVS